MIIRSNPDNRPIGNRSISDVAGPKWLGQQASQWLSAFEAKPRNISIDFGSIGFISLLEALTVTTYIEKLLTSSHANITIDFRDGVGNAQILPLETLKAYRKADHPLQNFTSRDVSYSERVYTVAGFLESLGLYNVLNRPDIVGQFSYSGVSTQSAQIRSYYASRRSSDLPTILFGLTRIGLETKQDCRQFLDEERILSWREVMAPAFSASPIIESAEIWSVLCHELAVNVWEHAKGTGFLAARIVKSSSENWCSYAYPSIFQELDPIMQQGFLEICVADAGCGFMATLGETFRQKFGTSLDYERSPIDIVAFALDELGTSKTVVESWITERHALGQILQTVAKYGGLLRVRSDGADVFYVSQGGSFMRRTHLPGYEPHPSSSVGPVLPGSQLQVLLPLFPTYQPASRILRSVSEKIMPANYWIEEEYPQGLLIALETELSRNTEDSYEESAIQFRAKCENLCNMILQRSREGELIVLDFHALSGWTPAKFETLLHLLQNVLKNRPALLIEIDSQLADLVIELEATAAPTCLTEEYVSRCVSPDGRAFRELPEKTFMETFSCVYSTVLAIDNLGRRFLCGLRDRRYEAPLLSLIDHPKSIAELCATPVEGMPLKESVFRAILHALNPLFQQTAGGQWKSVWTSQQLDAEARRSIAAHFDEIAALSQAWRCEGEKREKEKNVSASARFDKTPIQNKDNNGALPIFNLPWQNMWAADFLECSRILSRERYADDVGQRLFDRLKKGLSFAEISLESVKLLACVTSPAMMLASAIRKWWDPPSARPSIIDLGYDVMLSPSKEHPLLLTEDIAKYGVVIVQDVMDSGSVSGRLIRALQKQNVRVLCVIGFVQLEDGITCSQATPNSGIWMTQQHLSSGLTPAAQVVNSSPESHDSAAQRAKNYPPNVEKGDQLLLLTEPESTDLQETEKSFELELPVPRHALIRVPRPAKRPRPSDDTDDSHMRWIEPRALRPVEYRKLRREFARDRDLDLERRDIVLRQFDTEDEGCLIRSGHHAYGRRHFSITVDIRRLLTGPLGEEIARWVADVCEGLPERERKNWGRKNNPVGFSGDVSAVLMPLHSQIHYLWPVIDNFLAQRRRRQPKWTLDATLFSGRGPAYRIPFQFQHQIEKVVEICVTAWEDKTNDTIPKLRILIMDDTVATARTAESVLSALHRVVLKAFHNVLEARGLSYPYGVVPVGCEMPIEWVRYFAILNQMGESQHQLWSHLTEFGHPGIPLIFEEYAPFMGVPVYDAVNCPVCADRKRLARLKVVCHNHSAQNVEDWLDRRDSLLRPISVDGPDSVKTKSVELPVPIDILGANKKRAGQQYTNTYAPVHADTAIWRFYELMHLSYPVSDVLRRLKDWSVDSPILSDLPQQEKVKSAPQYERYRWAVLEWCLRNWPRVQVDTAEADFINAVLHELDSNSDLIPLIFDGLGVLHDEPAIGLLVACGIEKMLTLEWMRADSTAGNMDKESWGQHLIEMDMGLKLFWLQVPEEERTRLALDLSYFEQITDLRQNYSTLYDWCMSHNIQHGKMPLLYQWLNEAPGIANQEKESLDNKGHSFLRNLQKSLSRPQRHPLPHWALKTIAEALFRGRDQYQEPVGHHDLLPKLLYDFRDGQGSEAQRHLLQGTLSIFLAALDDLLLYARWPDALQIKERGEAVLNWLRLPDQNPTRHEPLQELRWLREEISLDQPFALSFRKLYHPLTDDVEDELQKYFEKAVEMLQSIGDFEFKCEVVVAESLRRTRFLSPIHRLILFLDNIAIDPTEEYAREKQKNMTTRKSMQETFQSFSQQEGAEKIISRIEIKPSASEKRRDFVCFRVLTGFASYEESKERMSKGPQINTDIMTLKAFGAYFEEIPFKEPSLEEFDKGFRIVCTFELPPGYGIRGESHGI